MLLNKLFGNRKIVALTGAGISEKSRANTFSDDNKIWRRYNSVIYANLPGLVLTLLTTPCKVIDFIIEIFEALLNVKPTHFVLSRLEEQGTLNLVIIPNMDNLHQESGNRKVIELHGNIFEVRNFVLKNRNVNVFLRHDF